MAKTHRILKSRKFFVLIYLMILISIGLLLGLLLFIYAESKGLYSADIEVYDRLIAQNNMISVDYEKCVQKVSDMSNGQEIDLVNIQSLVDEHQLCIDLLNDLSSVNEQILLLDLDDERLAKAQKSILNSESAIDGHEDSIDQLEKLSDKLNFQQIQLEAVKCYEQIDTDARSDQIIGLVKLCDQQLDETFDLLEEQDLFPETKKYHNEIKNYWDLTIRFNQAVESRNKEAAEELRTELELSTSKVKEYRDLSTEELLAE